MHNLDRKTKAVGTILISALFIVATQIPTVAGEERCRCFNEMMIAGLAQTVDNCFWMSKVTEDVEILSLYLYNVENDNDNDIDIRFILETWRTERDIGTGCATYVKEKKRNKWKELNDEEFELCWDCLVEQIQEYGCKELQFPVTINQ